MREAFITGKDFKTDALEIIERCNEILDEFAAQGIDLSLRGLYYRLVARGYIPNTDQSYKRIGNIVSDARLAGLIDWDRIIDRVRETVTPSHWGSPAEIVRVAARQFAIDKWENQPTRVEVIAEKDAVSSILEPVCRELDIPYTANRGYASSSLMYLRGKALGKILRGGQNVLVLYFGDHDPSGLDMDRDVEDRLRQFAKTRQYTHELEVVRLALTWPQIEEYEPPPNPAKLSDSRAASYITRHGDESWELDALDPIVLSNLVRKHVEEVRDEELWSESMAREDEMRSKLDAAIEAMED
jgi:hypothetical protein